ncbi:PLD nuclease N-terminal domain-containing protein [Luteimicrobium sp. DT211]|uniref:PLD nuclease N-terminal domain-containing protein n=1 Tax=Luteimicrobium sp. DT211 TaxID=3393412 RepID=UPI003CE97E07
MFRGLLVLVALGLLVYALTDCVTSQEKKPAGAPKALWILAIILLPVLGPVLWLVLSRSAGTSPSPNGGSRPAGPVAPDDDPDFLRRLDLERRRREQRDRRSAPHDDPQDPPA